MADAVRPRPRRHAERQEPVRARPDPRLGRRGAAWFVATALPGDPELDRRIARHRRERPADWPTIDVGPISPARSTASPTPTRAGPRRGPHALAERARRRRTGRPRPAPGRPASRPRSTPSRAIAARSSSSATRSGSGWSRSHPVSRAFRDLAGLVHQRFAAAADEVHLVVAGLPLTLEAATAADASHGLDAGARRDRAARRAPRWRPRAPTSTA